MSMRYKGSRLSATANTPTSLTASGAWTLQQQMQANGTSTWPFVRDPQFNYVTMLLHGDGSAGANNGSGGGVTPTVTNFNADASTNNFNVTINGDARSNNFTPYQGNGYYGVSFNGSSDYLTTPQTTSLNIGTGTFTVEAWVYLNSKYSSGGTSIINLGNGANGGGPYTGWGLIIDYDAGSSTAYPAWYRYDGSVTQYTSSTSLNVGQWYHLAVARDSSNNLAIWVNGARVFSTTSTVSFNAVNSDPLNIGRRTNGSANSPNWMNGYISNGRVVIGSNVYDPTSSSITVPTTPLTAVTNTQLLVLQSNRFIDNSSAARTITVSGGTPQVSPAQPFTLPSSVATYGSGYFDGTGDYLGVTGATTALAFGSGDFTIEFWGYILQTTPEQMFIDWRPAGTQTTQPLIYVTSAGVLAYYVNAANRITGATLVTGQWYHIAVSRSGTSTKMFLNGVQTGSTWTDTTVYTNTSTRPLIGLDGNTGNSGYLKGNVTDVRTLTGTALYTTTFTPPTTPLTAITNTSLLTTQYNGGGNNSGFKDSSQFNFPITRNGNTTQGTFTPYGSNWSNYFDGSGDYLTLANATTLAFSTNDFTVEGWFNFSSSSAPAPYNQFSLINCYENQSGSSGFSLGVSTSANTLNVGSGDTNQLSTSFTISIGTWYHIAVSRSGGTIRLFVNGALATSASNSTNFTTSTNPTSIGSLNVFGTGYTMFFNGYASNVRIVKGTGVYTSAFTPSTTPLTAITNTALLTCQSNRFIDNSSNTYTITKNGDTSVQRFSPFANATAYNPATTGGSGYFDGSGDYLTAPANANLLLNGTNSTIEGWWYLNAAPGAAGSSTPFFAQTDLTSASTSGTSNVWCFSDATTVYFSGSSDSGSLTFSASLIPVKQWFHLAWVITSGTSAVVYLNGVSVASGSINAVGSNTSYITVLGTIRSGGGGIYSYLNGFSSNFRIVKGSQVYTSAFTPPTAPLTPTANTSLLLSNTNSAILDQSMMNNLETVGNAAVSTSVVKYGTASMYFDGTGDGLFARSTPDSAFGTGDFTVEFWLNLAANLGSFVKIVMLGTTGNCFTIETQSTLNLLAVTNKNSTVYFYSSTALTTGTWIHVAVSRSSGTMRLFQNGTQVGSAANTVDFPNAGGLYIGRSDVGQEMNGYIDDLRITKYARYTTTFTPPTQALPNG